MASLRASIRAIAACLLIIELGKSHLGVGVDENLLVDPTSTPLRFRRKKYLGADHAGRSIERSDSAVPFFEARLLQVRLAM
jgi:hypothetical protein